MRARPWILLVGLVCACAAPRMGAEGVDPGLLPRQAAADPVGTRGRRVQWGGAVLQVSAREDSTELEVLAYPLWDSGRPRTEGTPLGRFLVRRSGHPDPVGFARGSLVTAAGRLAGTAPGRTGEAGHVYPLVEAEVLQRWPVRYPAPAPRVHFGIGVSLP